MKKQRLGKRERAARREVKATGIAAPFHDPLAGAFYGNAGRKTSKGSKHSHVMPAHLVRELAKLSFKSKPKREPRYNFLSAPDAAAAMSRRIRYRLTTGKGTN